MTERANVRKSGNRPTYVGLKLALAASSLVASLIGARMLARASASNPAQDNQAAASQQQVIIVRRYVEVGSGAPVSAGSSAVTLPAIPTAVPYVAPPPVTTTRSS